jgi:hypothetical protein
MRSSFLVISFVIAASAVSAQSLTPEVIATAGNSYSTATAKIEFTIGEVATSSLTAGSNTLTQGFHQPEIHFSSLDDYSDDFAFTLYPNPTEQFVTVASTKREDMQIHVYDANGKAMMVSSIFQEQITVDLHILAAGTYILVVTTKAGQPLHSYSVIKKSNY